LIQQSTQHALKQLSLGLALLGLCGGFLLSYGVLAGDVQGRVNLLFLLLLFAFLPVAALLLSLIFLLKGGGKGLAGWLFDLPLWPRHLTLELPRLGVNNSRGPWLFYQTQILSLSFSSGCLLLYLLLLLGSDISFVWRSTLLDAGDILPALNAIALPWRFWPEAQASIELVERTRDFRLDPQTAIPMVGLWWKYILAAQVSYNLLPRTHMMLVARHLYLQRLRQDDAVLAVASQAQQHLHAGQDFPLAELVGSVATPYVLLDWAGTPTSCQEQLQQLLGDAENSAALGPLPDAAINGPSARQSVVVLVKSWEPPLAELADQLRRIETNQEKLILPLDWRGAELSAVDSTHLNEWRRFAATLPKWKVLQLEGEA
jgi:hypothetical protein